MKKFLNEFKEFALKGNVMNLAIGIIIGAAFQGVVTSLTENILSPIIGLITGQNIDWLEVELFGVVLKYGAFITSIINFIIMALVVFLIVKGMNALARPAQTEEAPEPRKCPFCKTAVDESATKCPACTSSIDN